MHLHKRASDVAPPPGSATQAASAGRLPRPMRQPPLSQLFLGMPGRVWSMVAWGLLSAALLSISLVLPLADAADFPVVTLVCVILLLIGVGGGLIGRSRTPEWWIYANPGLWIFITCWLLSQSTQLEASLLLFGLVVCAVYVGYWFPRPYVIAYAAAWTLGTLVVFLRLGAFEHTVLMWLTASTISVALAMFLSTVTSYLHQQATRDPLTGLLNRTGLLGIVTGVTPQDILDHSPITAIVMDLDDFKEINDSRGHAAGDEALVSVAATLRRGLRVQDIVARTGGDEFVVIMPRTTEVDAINAINRIAATSAVRWSFGSAPWHPEASFDDLIAAADLAMYSMKSARDESKEAR